MTFKSSLGGLATARSLRWIILPFRRIALGVRNFHREAKEPTDTVAYFNSQADKYKFLIDHLAFVAPVLAAAMVAIKSMGMTRGDVAAALVVAGSFSLTQWALALLISFAPFIYALVYQWRSISIPGSKAIKPPYRVWFPITVQGSVVAIILASILIPLFLVIAVALLLLWAFWHHGAPEKGELPKASGGSNWYAEKNQDIVLEGLAEKLRNLPSGDLADEGVRQRRRVLNDGAILRQEEIHSATQRGRLAFNMLIAFGLTVPYVASVATFPTENVELKSDTLSGYVLRVDSEWTTMLERESRKVRYLPTSEVRDRSICVNGGSKTSTWSVLLRPPAASAKDYARCVGT